MRLTVPLPDRLSVIEAARIARAVSVAVEAECGFVTEPTIVDPRDLAVDEENMLALLVTVDAILQAAALEAESIGNLRHLRDWIRQELRGSADATPGN